MNHIKASLTRKVEFNEVAVAKWSWHQTGILKASGVYWKKSSPLYRRDSIQWTFIGRISSPLPRKIFYKFGFIVADLGAVEAKFVKIVPELVTQESLVKENTCEHIN